MLSKFRILGALWAALVLACVLVPGASAVVVHTPSGHFLGLAPRPGIAPAAIPGSVAAADTARRAIGAASAGMSWENLNYQGGPVLHSSDPYVIYWNPNGDAGPSLSLIESYFRDVAADSTRATNAYAVARQFTDTAGFADYQQSFNSGPQVIQDFDNFQPAPSECAGSPYATCVSDGQLQAEISSVIAAAGLPTDGPAGASELPSGAPIYFVVLPSDVDVCDSSGSCASNYFCAYHSDYQDGSNNVLYAAIPSIALDSPDDAKSCQWDGNSAVQEPNGSLTDVVLKYISHEDNETITDPLGTGWYSNWTGNENGDNCNDTDWSANAFTPTLGGDASAGTLYNQIIGPDHYYLQSEWSNGGSTCLMQASGGTITPRFGVSAGPRGAGSAVTFDPTGSTGTYKFTSETWDFGDQTPTSFHAGSTLTSVTHTYAAAGRYTVTLTLVDSHGELTTTSEPITVGESPTAAITASPATLPEGSGPVSFDASGSTTDATSISSYAWDFGDGATAVGATASHTYATAGTYLVRLTVTDSAGNVDTTSTKITVTDEPPVAAFATGVAAPEAGQSVAFDGSSSSDADGSITRYAWNFGDGHTATGAKPTHTFAGAGTYSATLTVTDSSGQHASIAHSLTVLPGPTARFTLSATQVQERAPIHFDGTGSAAGGAGGAIQSYAWTFGDGATGTGSAPTHAYNAPGTYTVKLSVTDSAGITTSITHTVTVLDEPPTAAFGASPSVPIPGQSVTFNAGGSGDPDGAIASYAWDFGDGNTGTGQTPSHAYAAPGTYTVSLTVVDSGGQRASVSEPVTVYAQPAATFSYSPQLPVEGVATAFTAISSSPDPSTMISSYQWDFGDGTTAGGASPTHTYAHEGSYRVTLTVTDGLGLTSSISEAVTVIDAAPTAVISVLTAQPLPGHPVLFSGGRSHDADDPIVSYLWHFAGGAGGVAKKLSYTFRRAGTYRVSLTVRDSFGQTATTTTTVRVGRPGDVSQDRRSSRRRRRKR